MKLITNAGLLGGTAVLLFAASAAAQEVKAETGATLGTTGTAEATADTTAAPAATETATTTEEMPAEEPAPVVEETAAEPAAEEAAAEEEKSPLSFSLFADANYTIQSSGEGTAIPVHRAYAGAAPVPNYVPSPVVGPYTGASDTGFALSFAGIDAVYDEGEFGATVSLRFGRSAQLYHFNSSSIQGTIPLTQAYGTWKPTDSITVDMGMFGTIFGAEVAESWKNLNYSRGGLYFAMQPFWHTGVRVGFQLTDTVGLKVMVVNDANRGWNTDNPAANIPVGALQLAFSPNEMFNLYVGGMVAEDGVASGFETFADVVATLSLDKLFVVFNGDVNFVRSADVAFGGISLAAGYSLTDMFGIAGRFEALFNPGTANEFTLTETLTLDVKPIKDSSNLIIRGEGRLEEAATQIFLDSQVGGAELPADLWAAGIVSLVVTTDG